MVEDMFEEPFLNLENISLIFSETKYRQNKDSAMIIMMLFTYSEDISPREQLCVYSGINKPTLCVKPAEADIMN